MQAKILLLAGAILTGQAYAAAESAPSSQALAYLKEKFTASYHGEFYLKRRDTESTNEADHDIQDLSHMHVPTVTYSPLKDWQFMATAEFKYSDNPGAAGAFSANGFYRALYTVTKKDILTEKANGLKLDAGVGRRDFNTRIVSDTWGNNRVFATITKTYDKNNGSLFVQYLYNDSKVTDPTSWKHAIELIPSVTIQLSPKLSYFFNDDIFLTTPKYDSNPNNYAITHEMNLAVFTYQFNDKISAYYQLKYYHTENFTNDFASKKDYGEYYVGATYAFTPKLSLAAEIGSEIYHSNDGKGLFSKKAAYPELAFYADASF